MMDFYLTLKSHVASGIVRSADHPTLPLTIYNYSERCQYDRLWDDVALQCRGLVMCGDEIVARPFRKFFNDTEHADGEIPWHLPCEATEKLDGSLLIAFKFRGGWNAATRGSFTSEQAVEGGKILTQQDIIPQLDPAVTYLWEVIYPGNRIVVDYGARRECVLLAMIETATGHEVPLENAPRGVPVVRRLPPTANHRDLRSIIRDDEEGYVLRFDNGFRIKVKGARYMELHRAISGISSRMVWEYLSQGKPLDEVLSIVPDEFASWAKAEAATLRTAYELLLSRAMTARDFVLTMPTRKEQALSILANFRDVSGAAFTMLDGKDPSVALWKMVYPEFRRPRVMDEE